MRIGTAKAIREAIAADDLRRIASLVCESVHEREDDIKAFVRAGLEHGIERGREDGYSDGYAAGLDDGRIIDEFGSSL